MAARTRITARRPKAEGRISEQQALRLLDELEKQPPLLSRELVSAIEDKIKLDAYRHVALMFLSKPFKEMVKTFSADRETAVAFADIAHGAHAASERYKSLGEFLETASTHISIALCVRPDMKQVLEGGKPTWLHKEERAA
jgi:hypothetical protein